MNYVPLNIKTHYSLLHSTIRSDRLAAELTEKKSLSCGLADYGISSAVSFVKAIKGKEVKPILGVTLYICEDNSTDKQVANKPLSYLNLIAKNKEGWKQLIKITSFSNSPLRWDGQPRLSLADLATFSLSNLICIAGGSASVCANAIFENKHLAYDCSVLAEEFLYHNWKIRLQDKVDILKNMFGGDFYLGISLNDPQFDCERVIAGAYREITDVPKVAFPDIYYLKPDDALDQRVLLCTYLKKDMASVLNTIKNEDEHTLGQFFLSDKFYLRDELGPEYTQEELSNSFKIGELCEPYDILGKPVLPLFPCPNGQTPEEYLRELCREGWKKKIANKIPKDKQPEYAERIKYELQILQEAELSSYFLILVDILNWVRLQGYLCGYARGSSAGCLTSYLIGITAVDPIKHELYFERFWNASRKGSMPDIDIDIPQAARAKTIQYMKDKFGADSVSQMITYQNLKGRSALKAVLTAYGGISFGEMNSITSPFPSEASIAGELQEMTEEEGEASLIKWVLENRSSQLREWCSIDENGVLSGTLAKRFEQAIRLEGIKKAQSKHAAGLVLSPGKMDDMCPLIYDKSEDSLIAGYEMKDIEAIGLVKYDILGLSTLDRIMKTQHILKGTDNECH